jgi:hypothetical protein
MAPTELPVCTSLTAIIRPSADDDDMGRADLILIHVVDVALDILWPGKFDLDWRGMLTPWAYNDIEGCLSQLAEQRSNSLC